MWTESIRSGFKTGPRFRGKRDERGQGPLTLASTPALLGQVAGKGIH